MDENIEEKKVVMVTTINGISANKKSCRKISGEYYIIGDIKVKDSGDCYYINDKYYRMETGYITYDYELEEYVIKNSTNLINGVVGIVNNELIYGYFTPHKFKNIIIIDRGDNITGLSSDIFKSNNQFRERLYDGIFYNINDLRAVDFNTKHIPSSSYKRSLEYNCKNIIKDYIDDYNNNDLPINNNIKIYGDVTKDLSFGLEFETTIGNIQDRLAKPLGLIPLRDGSIPGIEYVTIPLTGKKGLQSIVESCKLLKERTDFDDSCALHLHIGGIPRTMEFILALYKTLVHIQDDMYNMFPLYKKYNFGVKREDYSKQLPSHELISQMDKVIDSKNIVNNFDVLFTYLSQGFSFKNNYNTLDDVKSHPSNPDGDRKWQVGTRYLWANMIPLIFDNKQTVEFRIHTPTFEVNKVINYVIMCSSIINFVKDNTNDILSDYSSTLRHHNLKTIVQKAIYNNNNLSRSEKDSVNNNIHRYINNRKEVTYSQNCNGNIRGNEDEISEFSRINWNTSIVKPRYNIINTLESIPQAIAIDPPAINENAFNYGDLENFLADLANMRVDRVNRDDVIQEVDNVENEF